MTNIGLSNINLSYLRNQLYMDVKKPISFSQLYNYSTDIPKIGNINIKELFGKYRTYIPKDTSNLIAWYDANNISYSNYLYNNIPISIWKDLSGSNNNAIQDNIVNQPAYYNSSVNGYPGVLFYNYSHLSYPIYLKCNPIISTTALTIAAVFNTSGTKSNYLFSCDDISIRHTSRCPTIFVNTTTNTLNTITNFKYLDYVPNIYIATFYIDSTGYTRSQLRYNGNIQSEYIHDNSLTTFNINNLYIGCSNATYTNVLNGNISELIIYNNKLPTSNLLQLEGYLASKWWGVPSYILPPLHIYNNVSVLNPVFSPLLSFNFDANSISSNVINLNNYGTTGSNLNGNINIMNYYNQCIYYPDYTNHLNDLYIWYKFDSSANTFYDNKGYGGVNYNLIVPNGVISTTSDYVYGNGCLYLTPTQIASTNNNVNLLNFNNLSSQYTISFWYKVFALIATGDTLFSLSGAPNIGSRFFIQREGSTNNIIIGVPNSSYVFRIYNAIYSDNIWRHIAVTLTKSGTTDLIMNVYLNGIIKINNIFISGSWFINTTNYIVINQYATGTGYYSANGANMFYDDFRLYLKTLTQYQIQSIMGYPISQQNGNKNTYGYLWNSYTTNINSIFNINYSSFINNVFITNNVITISYDLQTMPDSLYTGNYETNIIHCCNANVDKLKIVHRFFTASTNYIKIIINDPSTTNPTTVYFQNTFTDNLTHNYIFTIPITLTGPNTILLYVDGISMPTVNVSSIEPSINKQFVNIGSYYNSISSINVVPFRIEDLKIYNRKLGISEINYITSNYNIIPSYNYYNCNIYPYTNMLFNNCYATSNAYGPNYTNIINNYSSNGYWIYNNINITNGIQKFTVPQSGYYNIIAAGACGGPSYTNSDFGRGIIVKNNIYLQKNNILYILIGQKGGTGILSGRKNVYPLHGQGGGGGGTYIINSNNSSILLIAGGGGGSGQLIVGGGPSTGSDGINTTNGNLDSANNGINSANGNGGNIGLCGTASGAGCGGGGYYTDGQNKAGIYGGQYSGICFNNILLGSNIGTPFYQNSGGIGGFGGGATGGTNYSIDLVWGGGGGGGYSGGVGGSASYYEGQTFGGGGGGSYDINGFFNNATMTLYEGNSGYNISDGYAKIKFLTPYSFLSYANVNNNIIKEGLTYLIEPFNNICYNPYDTPTSITNLVNASYSSLNGYYSYDYLNNGIKFDNFSSYNDLNNSYLNVNTFDNINSVSIWYMVLSEPNQGSCFIDTFNDFGHIYDGIIGADWGDGIKDADNCGTMYINNNKESYNINWNNLIYPLNVWRNVTLLSNSNLSNEITFFCNDNGKNGIKVAMGPILIYNRQLSIDEHIQNYNVYKNSTYLS